MRYVIAYIEKVCVILPRPGLILPVIHAARHVFTHVHQQIRMSAMLSSTCTHCGQV